MRRLSALCFWLGTLGTAVAKSRRKATCFLPLLLIIQTCACSKDIDPSKLPGTYEAHFKTGVEILTLRTDGTYTQYFTPADGVTSTYSNRWKFEPFDGEPKIALQCFTSHFPESSKGDIVLLGVQREWDRTRPYRSYALEQYYVKTGPSGRTG